MDRVELLQTVLIKAVLEVRMEELQQEPAVQAVTSHHTQAVQGSLHAFTCHYNFLLSFLTLWPTNLTFCQRKIPLK